MHENAGKAASLIQARIDSRTVESAVHDVRQGSYSFERAFGKAASADAVLLLTSITKSAPPQSLPS